MIVLFARELSSRDYTVTVYCNLTEGRCTDVNFEALGAIHYYDKSYINSHRLRDILIAFKAPEALTLSGPDKKYLWTADANSLNATQRRECNGMVAIGKWHLQELKSINMGYNRLSCIEPGVNVQSSPKVERIPKQCLYASSPDRGLDFLLEIWPSVLIKHPDATLITTYTDDHRRTNEEMDTLYQQSDILTYPCTGQERYCLTAIKAQINGCIPCVIPHMALQDTVQFGIKALKSNYLSAIIDLLDEDDRTKQILRDDMVKNVKYNTWNDVVDQWENLIGGQKA